MFCKDCFRTLITVIDEVLHFLINFISDFFTVRLIVLDVTAKEHIAALSTRKLDWTNFVTHSVFSNHFMSDTSCSLEVIMRSGTNLTKDDFLRNSSSE